jgi:hypothetical protein
MGDDTDRTQHTLSYSQRAVAASGKGFADVLCEHMEWVFKPSRVAIPNHVTWRGIRINTDLISGMTRQITTEVVWELFELGFRFDLLLLDRIATVDKWAENAELRETQVLQVFPGIEDGCPLVGTFPVVNVGLAAASWSDREGAVESLRKVLSSHQGAGQSLQSPISVETCQEVGEEIERECISFFCSSFFSHFGHAPLTLHRLADCPPMPA